MAMELYDGALDGITGRFIEDEVYEVNPDELAAFEKGFKQATKAWGRDLPDISNKTYDAVKDMFSNYYESKNVITDDQE